MSEKKHHLYDRRLSGNSYVMLCGASTKDDDTLLWMPRIAASARDVKLYERLSDIICDKCLARLDELEREKGDNQDGKSSN